MGYLTRDAILRVTDLQQKAVDVPEWGGQVLVRELTASEVEKIGFDMADGDGNVDKRRARGMMSRVVAWATIDQNGKRIFSEADVDALGQKSFKPVQRIANAVMQMSGMGAADEDDLGNG
jgi:hypothetical protein